MRYTEISLTSKTTLRGEINMRILTADAQPKVRFALRVLLDRQPGLEVVGEAVDAQDLLTLVETACPDAVLLGWELPGMVMDDLLPMLREVCPEMVVIALSGRLEAQHAAQAVGVDAFVSKSSPPECLLQAITSCQRKRHSQPRPSGTDGKKSDCLTEEIVG
jgi:DNA-binding NarL/FixJ family response regulator